MLATTEVTSAGAKGAIPEEAEPVSYCNPYIHLMCESSEEDQKTELVDTGHNTRKKTQQQLKKEGKM